MRIDPPVIACSSWRKFSPVLSPPLSSSSASPSPSFSFFSAPFAPSDFFTTDFSSFGFVSSPFDFALRSPSSSDVAKSESDRTNVDS